MKIEIPEPCQERWSSMERRGDGRYCARCDHVVLDLSAMTRRQAERRVARVEGSYVCVRIAADDEGAPIFRPEPSRARHFAGGLVLVAALSAGCGGRREPTAELASEPCTVPVPPMLPVDAAPAEPMQAIAQHEIDVSDPVDVRDPAGASDVAVTPTAEQRELTRRKRRGELGATTQPVVRHLAGRMPLRR